MIRGHTVGVVIPCYNEERGLQAIFPRVPPTVDEVIVVDNNSTDRTAEVARAHGARVIFEREPGYGRAYQVGFAAATADILVSMDGDGQYPIEDVPRLVGMLLDRDLDFLSGCRFPLSTRTMSVVRRFGNWALTAAARLLFGVHIRDTQSGMWIFHRSVLDRVSPQHPSMPFSEEFKLKVVLGGLKFGEEHIAYHQREGVSTLRPLRHGWENVRYVLRLRVETRSRRPPAAASTTSARASVRERVHSMR